MSKKLYKNTKPPITFKDIQKAYVQAAKIVSVYGEKYLPIFERVETEYLKHQKKMETLCRINEIAVDKEN